MDKNFLIISVESRKGGVGKTTAALNLAKILLLKKNYSVLYLDVDITGTNATDSVDSPYWENLCYSIEENQDGKTHTANLLALFEQQFMTGKNIPRFVIDGDSMGENEHSLNLSINKINILGSQIYQMNETHNNKGKKYICKPGILFDELHAFWFIEFLQNICENFFAFLKQNYPERSKAIIIDNSPGYVGIAPAIQEWLTNIGPVRGKFLTVSSLDRQDLLSCFHAVKNLHFILTNKWNSSRKYLNTLKPEKVNQEDTLLCEEENFFLNLIESDHIDKKFKNVCDLSEIDRDFYCEENSNLGNSYKNQIDKYQGFLINKVPRMIKRGVYNYDIDEIFSKFDSHPFIFNRKNFVDFMVEFDEYIEYQFLQSLIYRREGHISRRKKNISEFLEIIIKRNYTILHYKLFQDILFGNREFNKGLLNQLRIYFLNLHEIVRSIISFSEQSGFSHITSLIHEEWLPGSIIRDFRTTLQGFLLEAGVPFVEFSPIELGEVQIEPEIMQVIERFRKIIKDNTVINETGFVHKFIPSLTVIIILSIDNQWRQFNLDNFLPEVFVNIASIEAIRWNKLRDQHKGRYSLQGFLANERFTEKEFEEYKHFMIFNPQIIESFPRLYSACSYAQARLIDMQSDTEFLIKLIKRLVMEDIEKELVLPNMRDVADNVIVNKNISHDSGYKQIEKGFNSAQHMEEFSVVLENILKKWEILE